MLDVQVLAQHAFLEYQIDYAQPVLLGQVHERKVVFMDLPPAGRAMTAFGIHPRLDIPKHLVPGLDINGHVRGHGMGRLTHDSCG
jgi:hypothetical protein